MTKPQCCRKIWGLIDRERIRQFDELEEKLNKKVDCISIRITSTE